MRVDLIDAYEKSGRIHTVSISVQTVKVLWSRAHDQCAFPGCSNALVQDVPDAGTGAVRPLVLGEQAHIRSSRPDGPRYDQRYPAKQIDTYENLILMCPTHHTTIDANGGAGYTAADLEAMRTRHEDSARIEDIRRTVHAYVAQQYGADDKVLFEQVDLHGPSVDSMFVDVPFACRPGTAAATVMKAIAAEAPGDVDRTHLTDEIVTGAAQALLHPSWHGHGLIVGGPGQGKSTLLQYVCQFHRARLLKKTEYAGKHQKLTHTADVPRVPIRLDLRKYAQWASARAARQVRPDRGKGKNRRAKEQFSSNSHWPTIEEYIAYEIRSLSGRPHFGVEELASLAASRPLLLALDGLDEVADLQHRNTSSDQILDTTNRLGAVAQDLVLLVATRPGSATSALWSSEQFPHLMLQRLTHGLRVQYLRQWAAVAKVTSIATDKLQRTILEHQHVPYFEELAAYPMQLAILLHLLYRRQLLPQRRTELYQEYWKTFLDREQGEDKEPLLTEVRQVIEDIHTFIGWHIHVTVEQGKSAGSISAAALKKLVRTHLADRQEGARLAERLFQAFTTRMLCLVERDPGQYQFDVQSLREYFAAVYLFEQTDRDARDDCLEQLLRRPFWSNVCRFHVGLYSRGEVRGMRAVMRELARKDANLQRHPMLRSTATLFLNDRTYAGQNDEPLREIVDFILEGPGTIFAADGLLDVPGSGFQLSDQAGRAQAIQHLKGRLESEIDSAILTTAASLLRWHGADADEISSWWWAQATPSWSWLQVASHLRLLNPTTAAREATLGRLIRDVPVNPEWLTKLLFVGGYDGRSNNVVAVIKSEINAGASDALPQITGGSTVAMIMDSARFAMARTTNHQRVMHRTRDRSRNMTIFADLLDATQALPNLTSASDGSRHAERLANIADCWGDGWVLRQALATLEDDVLRTLVDRGRHESLLATLISAESQLREHRNDVVWWKERATAMTEQFEAQHWLFSLLAYTTRAGTVTDLTDEINEHVVNLAPKSLHAVRNAISAHSNLNAASLLTFDDDIRLNRLRLSPASVWLAAGRMTESTRARLGKVLTPELGTLAEAGIADLSVIHDLVDLTKTFPVDTFLDRRDDFAGNLGSLKIAAVSRTKAGAILAEPHRWPTRLVQQAITVVEKQLLAKLAPVATIAEQHNWFEATQETW